MLQCSSRNEAAASEQCENICKAAEALTLTQHSAIDNVQMTT